MLDHCKDTEDFECGWCGQVITTCFDKDKQADVRITHCTHYPVWEEKVSFNEALGEVRL